MRIPDSKTLTRRQAGEVEYYTFPSLDELPFVRHGFSSRLGGVSKGMFSSMNLSFTRGDESGAVEENFHRFCVAIGVDAENVVISAQTHTTNLYYATESDRGRGITFDRGYTDVDGLITDCPGVVLCTQFADCVPLFFADPVRKVVATSHAGWRGTVAGMAEKTVCRMVADYGCRADNIIAGIGPSIGMCCFEVDKPVYDAFSVLPFFDDGCYHRDGTEKYHISLWEVNRHFLLQAGILPEHITVTDVCTRCHPNELWSHRACGKERGSLAAFIAIKDI